MRFMRFMRFVRFVRFVWSMKAVRGEVRFESE